MKLLQFGLIAATVVLASMLTIAPVVADDDTSHPAADDRPNIVIVLLDDMGFSDIGCFGGEIATPHIDSLAAGGLRFTQFHNAGRCCPTRASLLTGLYSHQAGIGYMTKDFGRPGYRDGLNEHCVTLADVASSAGYLSAISGKWHVGDREESMLPIARGFDRFYGVAEGGGFYFQLKPGRTIRLNDRVIASVDNPLPDDWYSTDAFTRHGIDFIDEAIDQKKPFLLYLAHNAPHFPLQADREDIELYRGRYRQGWDAVADARHERQLAMGILPPGTRRTPRPTNVADWQSLSPEDQNRYDHLMATHAACMHRVDQSIGVLIEHLKKTGQFDNTLICFLSDNGASDESGPHGATQGNPTTAKSNWYIGTSWAWACNTPFRRYKKFADQGGIATPMIAHWPEKIRDGGGFRHQVAHVIDFMPTVVALTGAHYPTTVDDEPIWPMEGVSLVAAFDDEPLDRDALFWEHMGNAAVRSGDEKLVRVGSRGKWELYDLANDLTEQHNIAGDHPQRVTELKNLWLRWAERCNVSTDGLPPVNGKN